MRLEFINRVTENDILGKSILTNDGGVLLRAGIKLTNQYIKKLREIGVIYLYIEDDRLDDVEIVDNRMINLKQAAMKSMGNIVKNIYGYNKTRTKDSLKIVENLVEYIIQDGNINSSLTDIKTYDNYTYFHCIDTGIMATFLGMSLGFNEFQLKELGKGALLHDIGKVKIPRKIINKKGRLTKEEFCEVKKHPLYGVDILKNKFCFSDIVLKTVGQHHEKVNGKGYPYGLSGNQISKYGKVVGVCDVYDAITNDRSYRKKFTPNDAYELILSENKVSFDEKVVKRFKDTFAIYPLGSCVKLSNGIEGYVIKQNKGFPDRPIIRVLYDSQTHKSIPFYEVDLMNEINATIVSIVE